MQNLSSGDESEDELEKKMELSYKQRQDERRSSQRPESSSTYGSGVHTAVLNNISIARLRSAQMRPSDLKPFSLNHAQSQASHTNNVNNICIEEEEKLEEDL